MAFVTKLPPEILQSILVSVALEDLVSLSMVCQAMYGYIKDNNYLFRVLYLKYFDKPPTNDLDWELEIRDYLRLIRICHPQYPKKASKLPFVHQTVKRLLRNSRAMQSGDTETTCTPPTLRNVQLLRKLFVGPENLSNREAFMNRSLLYERMLSRINHRPLAEALWEERQMSAELNCLFGAISLTRPRASVGPTTGTTAAIPAGTTTGTTAGTTTRNAAAAAATQQSRIQHYAAAMVYDLRRNSRKNLWGPFQDDGSRRVDWEKMEAILIDLRHNIVNRGFRTIGALSYQWNRVFHGCWPNSYVPIMRVAAKTARPLNEGAPVQPSSVAASSEEASALDALELQDPYSVSGTWMRLVCFLDYRDFFRFNFPVGINVPTHVPRDPPPGPYPEAVRSIVMKLRVNHIDPPGPKDHPDYPVVYFTGRSISLDHPSDTNANSNLRGHCRTTPEGDVHWTTISISDGEDQWRSETVQIGGHQSGRGVAGTWFDTNFDPQGPCGPTAFWKLHDRVPADDDDTPRQTLEKLFGEYYGNEPGTDEVVNESSDDEDEEEGEYEDDENDDEDEDENEDENEDEDDEDDDDEDFDDGDDDDGVDDNEEMVDHHGPGVGGHSHSTVTTTAL